MPNNSPGAEISPAELRAAAYEVLQALVGPEAVPREDQLMAAEALVVSRRRALVVQATGWGKSAVYWAATKALRAAGHGPTLVLSPLLALMRDQVEAATRAGLRAVTINSSNDDEWWPIYSDLNSDSVDVLLTSPERLANPMFKTEVMPWLLPSLGLLVIDEAHCISDWGHDFRPDYRRIADLLTVRPEMPVLATTATANARVTSDVAQQLGPRTLVLRGPLARESLHLATTDQMTVVEAFAWVDQSLGLLTGSGIIYVPTVDRAKELSQFLRSRGHDVQLYHGKIATDQRLEIEDLLRENRLKAVVATSALGMGYDKPDLGFVVHVGSPGSPVDYYQQVGRAGRGLDRAQVVLIPTTEDERLWQHFARANMPTEEHCRAVLSCLSGSSSPLQKVDISLETGIAEGRVEFLLKVLSVEGAVERTPDGWVVTGSSWVYDVDRYQSLRVARAREASLMRSYFSAERCLDNVLRQALDDPVSQPCGRCSACVGHLPAPLASMSDENQVQTAREFLRGQDRIIDRRKRWTPGLARSGKIKPEEETADVRYLAFGDDPAWPEVEQLLREPDQVAPEWLKEGVLDVIRRWRPAWPEAPVVIVPIPSSSRTMLISSLAESISDALDAPIVDALEITGAPADHPQTPKARATYQEARISLAPGIQFSGETVLLVDDRLRTRWTVTLAGALLREAGASCAMPFVVQRQPMN